MSADSGVHMAPDVLASAKRPLLRAISALLDEEPGVIKEDLAVRSKLGTLSSHLAMPHVREVCVNRPGEVWVETCEGWTRHEDESLSFVRLRELATAVATLTGQHTSELRPLLSAHLSSGERIQIVQPSACAQNTVVIAIRKPASGVVSLAELEAGGLFKTVTDAVQRQVAARSALLALHAAGRWAEFLRLAVLQRQNIVVAGATGSGKTTLLKALCQVVPSHERLITIEDAAELTLPNQPNNVNLFYSKGQQGSSAVTAAVLLEACLRLRPDRVIQAEIRGEEAFSFLDLAASGHPGSMTSVHAGSCVEAIERIALMVRKSAAGAGMAMDDIKRMAMSVIDVVVHMERSSSGFEVTDIVFTGAARDVGSAVRHGVNGDG
jgi:type IV secretion system protein VirB11